MKNYCKVTATLYFITAIIAAIFYLYYAVDAWVKERRQRRKERKEYKEARSEYEKTKDFYEIKVTED